jgi:hypothetical protein
MATVQPIVQPTYSILANTSPIESGVLMGVNITVADQMYQAIAIIETERGREGFPGPQGSGFRYIVDTNNPNNQIEASGTSDALYLTPSGTVQLGFNSETKTLTIGAQPFSTGSLVPTNIGGTNNPGLYDIDFLITYDGTKLISSPIDANLLQGFMTSGIYLKVGDGSNNRITYRISDRINFIASTGINISFDNINNAMTIATSKQPGLNSLVSQIIFG